MSSKPLWPHQAAGIDEVVLAVQRGRRLLLLTSPTGMGKSRIIVELIRHYARKGWKAVIYTNRRLLIDQLAEALNEAGIEYGVRAAGHEDERQLPVQIASLPTEGKRTLGEAARWDIHGFGGNCIAVIDEAHLNKESVAKSMIARHHKAGHVVLGVTATPLGLGDIYEELIVAGTLADGRACGAVVPCVHYGCDEPDLRHLKKPPTGDDFSEPELRKAFPKTPQLIGRVLDWYRRLNPGNRPTVLFACGVPESVWFAQEFTKAGIAAAHIDGNEVWVPLRDYDHGRHGDQWYLEGWSSSDREARRKVLDGSRGGDIKVLCNRFVLREGIDAPWLAHGIFATVFGSVQSYVQSGGRLLRHHPGLESVTLQDHGGNWWRHGSLNADRDWRLDCTAAMMKGGREEWLRLKLCRACRHQLTGGPVCPDCGSVNEVEPRACPNCARVLTGRLCLSCGYEIPPGVKSRRVVMADGTLREMRGDVFRPLRVDERPGAKREWVKWYYRALRGRRGLSFAQARALYAQEHDWCWPATTWPYMPKDPLDLYRPVRDVPGEDLLRWDSSSDGCTATGSCSAPGTPSPGGRSDGGG